MFIRDNSFRINLILDPLNGEICKIKLFNADQKQLDKLESIITTYFTSVLNLTRPLPLLYEIIPPLSIGEPFPDLPACEAFPDLPVCEKLPDLPACEELPDLPVCEEMPDRPAPMPLSLFNIAIDFSGHECDFIDRIKLFEHVAGHYHVKIKNLYPPAHQRDFYPAESDMKTLLNEWHEKIRQVFHFIPDALKTQLDLLTDLRPDYKNIFIFMLDFLETHGKKFHRYHGINAVKYLRHMQEDIEAFLNYDRAFAYLEKAAEFCPDYPPRLATMADLRNNHAKWKALLLNSMQGISLFIGSTPNKRYFYPAETVMKALINEWRDITMQNLHIIPYEFKLQLDSLIKPAPDYKNIFISVLEFIETHAKQFPDYLKDDIKALLNYDCKFSYLDKLGESCSCYPPRFISMQDLRNNYAKLKASLLITEKLKWMRMQPLADSLLFQLQMILLNDLCREIVMADVTPSLADIYDEWQKKIVSFNGRDYSMLDFMRERKTEISYTLWTTIQSPDVISICNELDKIKGAITWELNPSDSILTKSASSR